jgi:hypothetical protein
VDLAYINNLIIIMQQKFCLSLGECVVALKKKFGQSAQPFQCLLLHQGEVTGNLKYVYIPLFDIFS